MLIFCLYSLDSCRQAEIMWYQCLLTRPLAIDNRTRTTDRAETAGSAVLVPCEREPPDGGGVQGGGGPRARGVPTGGDGEQDNE